MMRPDILNRYFTPVSAVSGVGPKTVKHFARLFGLPEDEEPKLVRLLTHIPAGVIDRRNMPEIAFAAFATSLSFTTFAVSAYSASPEINDSKWLLPVP